MQLRKLALKDAPLMLEWMHDPDIADMFQKDLSGKTLEDAENFIQQAWDDNDNLHFAIVDDTDEYLGTISLKHIDRVSRNAEYAISMRKKAMGNGSARWATLEIIHYGFETLGLARIYLCVRSDNLRAIRFYEKTGFIFEGTFRHHIMVDGELLDLKWFAALKNRWGSKNV